MNIICAVAIALCATLICGYGAAHAETAVAIILDGYQKDCMVVMKGVLFPCAEKRKLTKGDQIIKKPNVDALVMKWAPYASGKRINAETILVEFDPPVNKKGVAQHVKEMLNFIKTDHTVSYGVVRGVPEERRVPQPGMFATVIYGQKISFVTEKNQPNHVIFKDSTGKKVFEKAVPKNALIELTPEEIGIRPNEEYRWYVRGHENIRQSKLRLLNDAAAKQIAADLHSIESEGTSSTDSAIKKAAYLQLMSDAYPEEIDLYWLSYRVLAQIKDEGFLHEDKRIIINELKRNYIMHIINSK